MLACSAVFVQSVLRIENKKKNHKENWLWAPPPLSASGFWAAPVRSRDFHYCQRFKRCRDQCQIIHNDDGRQNVYQSYKQPWRDARRPCWLLPFTQVSVWKFVLDKDDMFFLSFPFWGVYGIRMLTWPCRISSLLFLLFLYSLKKKGNNSDSHAYFLNFHRWSGAGTPERHLEEICSPYRIRATGNRHPIPGEGRRIKGSLRQLFIHFAALKAFLKEYLWRFVRYSPRSALVIIQGIILDSFLQRKQDN